MQMTSGSSNSVALGVEQTSDLHQLTVALRHVLVHRAFEQERVVAVKHLFQTKFGRVHEHFWVVFHEVPHALVRRNLGRLNKTRSTSRSTFPSTDQPHFARNIRRESAREVHAVYFCEHVDFEANF